jgi:tRNA dimethylallyltransferase
MSPPEQTAYILAGATATGKSATAQCLAEQLGYPILSADAMLVYQGMDIGTAKPTPRERGTVPYSGLDLVTPAEPFSTGRWLEAARSTLSANCHCPPIVVGGTGLYIKALTDGIASSESSPELRAKWQALFEQEGLPGLQAALRERAPDRYESLADTTNPRRLLRALEQLERDGSTPQQWKTNPRENAPIIVLTLPREQLHRRIAKRVDQMFDAGLLEEVRVLRETYPVWSTTASKAIGYEEACAILDGKCTREVAREKIIIRTRQLAKRQETWFRHQAKAHWLSITEHETPEMIAQRVLDLWRTYGPTSIRIPGE